MCAAKFKHLSLQDRFLIEQELNHNSSFKKIALATGKDCSTISKEVRLNLSSSKFIGFNVSYNPCLFWYYVKKMDTFN